MATGAREKVEMSDVEASFVRRRVQCLVVQDRAPIDLACDAYIQGLTDAGRHLSGNAVRFVCPLGGADCVTDCGSYGCGN